MLAWIKQLPRTLWALLRRLAGGLRRRAILLWRSLRRSNGRILTQGAMTIAVIAGVLGLAVYAVPHVGPDWAYGEQAAANETVTGEDLPLALPPGLDAVPGAPGVPVPGQDDTSTTSPTTGPEGDLALKTWADKLAHLGISSRALQAYGHAEMVLRSARPNCHLSWTTLAGIGSVETNHGTTGGTALDAGGRPQKPIRGPALDGTNGNGKHVDSDDGAWDDDKVYDRAVGPMQFIPQTWKNWAADGDGDGDKNPNDIDDAAVAAGHYLCADNRDLARATDWYAAVYAYNHLDTYVREVYERADDYGKRSKTAG